MPRYYAPPPEDVRRKYRKMIPPLGFSPLPDACLSIPSAAREEAGA